MFGTLVEQPGTTPFASVAKGASEQPQNSQDEQVINGTAQLAALNLIGPDKGDLIDAWEKVSKEAADTVRISGDYSIRMDAALRQKQNELNGLAQVTRMGPSLDPDGSLAQGAVLAARATLAEDDNRRAQYALEQESVKNLQALAASDPVQAKVMMDNIENGGPLDIQRDMLAKRMILQREIAKATSESDNRALIESAADAVMGLIPFRSSGIREGNVDIDAHLKNWYDKLFAGERQTHEANALWSMPMKDFVDYVPTLIQNVKTNSNFLGYESKAAELNLLTELGGQTPAAWQTNAMTGLDIVGIIPFGKAGSAASYALRAGARREAIDLIASDVIKGTREAAILDNALPHSMANGPAIGSVSPALGVAEKLEQSDRLIQALPKVMTQRFATPEELNAAVKKTVSELDAQTGTYSIVDTKKVSVPLADGTETYRVEGTIGKKDGTGFASEKQAKTAATKMGVEGVPVQDTSGTWFIKAQRDVSEMGFYDTDISTQGATNVISRHVLGSRQLLDDFTYASAQQSGGAQRATMEAFRQPIKDSFGKLKGREMADLGGVIKWGQENEKWLTKEEFSSIYERAYKRAPREAEVSAYQAYRSINDAEHDIRNAAEFKKRVTKGYETVTLEGPGFKYTEENAIVKRGTLELPEGTRAYDVGTGTLYNNTNKLTPEILSDLRTKGYMLVETERPLAVREGSPVRSFLVRKGDFKADLLKMDQLGYAEGGHRFYMGTHYAKQAVEDLLEDGSKVMQAPRTYITGSRAEMLEWTKLANELRDYVKTADNPEIAEMWDIIGKSKAKLDPEAFLKDWEAGRISKDHPFEAVEDRQMPSAYKERSSQWAFDEDLSLSQGAGQMYYSGKGEILKDYQGQFARTMDPYRAINRSLQNLSQTAGFTDFKLSSISRWVNTYRRLNILDFDNLQHGVSDEFMFSNGRIKKGTPDKIRQIAEGQRDSIQRILNWKTDNDLAIESMGQRVAEYVAGDSPGLRDQMVTATREWYKSNNPLNFFRGWAFDATLGMFNVSQLYVQSSTFLAISAMNLRGGAHAFMGLLPSAAYMYSHGSEAILENMAKGAVPGLMGFSSDEFKLYMRTMRNSGILDIGGSHSLIGEYGASVSAGAFSAVEKVRAGGRVFFNTAESANLQAAYRSSWLDISESYPKLDKEGREFQRLVYSKATDYGFGMQREAQAWWQRGLMSVPTQFFAYNARMLEAMFSKTFTKTQRARLVASQFMLYGTAGIPLASMVSDKVNEMMGKAPSPGTLPALFQRGMVDQLYYMATGEDVQLGNRQSSGEFLQNTARDLFGVGEYGPVSVADMFGGASYQIWGGAIGDMGDWAKYAIAESGTPGAEALSREAALKLARNVSSVDRYLKAAMIQKYGTYSTRNGVTLVNDLPSTSSYWVAMMAGGSPGELRDMAVQLHYKKNHDKAVDDAAKVLRNYRTDYLNKPDQRPELRQQMSLFSNLLPDNIRREAIRKSNKESESLYKAIAERADKLRQQEDQNQNGQLPTEP